jgi:hypothetical protein
VVPNGLVARCAVVAHVARGGCQTLACGRVEGLGQVGQDGFHSLGRRHSLVL